MTDSVVTAIRRLPDKHAICGRPKPDVCASSSRWLSGVLAPNTVQTARYLMVTITPQSPHTISRRVANYFSALDAKPTPFYCQMASKNAKI